MSMVLSPKLMRTGLSFALAVALVPALVLTGETLAQTPQVSPEASAGLPEGRLGEQIRWVLDTLHAAPEAATTEEIEQHIAPEFLQAVPADQLALTLAQLGGSMGPFFIEVDSITSTRDLPPTNARFILVGANGDRLETSIAIDRETGLITGLLFQPAQEAPSEASPVATPATVTDVEVSFESGGDTVYGALMAPSDIAGPGLGALIISGSGPTDRNGNSGPLTAMNTNLNLATTLAGSGVTSLRYDKLGSGKTGLGARAGEDAGYDVFLQEVRDAATFLAEQPGVDAANLILVGHSEGALYALVLAQEMADAGTPPAGVILASPISIRYLDLLIDQLSGQLDAAAAAGQLTQEEADTGKREVASIVEGLRSNGELPDTFTTPGLESLFNPANIAFLVQIDAIDPGEVAARLPPTLPVLVLHGGKDEQVTAEQVDHLLAGFAEAGNDAAVLVNLPDANHLLKVVEGAPNAAVDYANPNLPFAPDAVSAIEEFLGSLQSA